MNTRIFPGVVLALCCWFVHGSALADGSIIDKIYHPYVQPEEREFEFRASKSRDDDDKLDGLGIYRLGYGQSIRDDVFAELYMIGKEEPGKSLHLDAFEMEVLWQITEQGEYWADWGLLVEAERETHRNIWELSTALLIEKEWNRWVGTANLYLTYEWGMGIDNEFETAMALQGRYRYSRFFEPALELYVSQETRGLGPVLRGDINLQGRQKLRWEAGVIFGIDDGTANQTLKGMLEYEF